MAVKRYGRVWGKAKAGAAVAGSLDHRLACRREKERDRGPIPPYPGPGQALPVQPTAS